MTTSTEVPSGANGIGMIIYLLLLAIIITAFVCLILWIVKKSNDNKPSDSQSKKE